MANKLKILGLLLFSIIVKSGYSQQDPIFTQYMFGMQVFNPAYTGRWQNANITFLARKQWMGFDLSPGTQSLLFQAPMRNKQIAMGLNIINDNIGFEKKLSINADYSYRIKLSETSNLSFGLKAGIVNYSNNLYQYKLFEQGNDPKFAGEIEQKVSPNFGVGVFFYQPAFYIGFSVPKLLENTFKSSENYFIADIEQRHYYLTGAYVFELVEGIVFKPSLLINTVVGAPVQANFSANFLVAGKVWIGALFRTNDACGVMVQWVVDNKIRIGYATDFSLTNLKSYNSGTHEIMFSIDFRAIKQRFIKPRYF